MRFSILLSVTIAGVLTLATPSLGVAGEPPNASATAAVADTARRDSAEVAFREGLDLLARGAPREALPLFELALAKGYEPVGEAYLRLGITLKQIPLRKFDAIRALRRAIREDSANLEALYELTDTYLLLDGWEAQREARRALFSILERDPLFRDAFPRWQSLYLDEDEHAKLAARLRSLLQRTFDPRVAALTASLYLQAGQLKELEGLLDYWEARPPPLAGAYHYYRARSLFLRGREAEGTGSFLAGLEAVQTEDDLAPYLEDLEPLLGDSDRELRSFRSLGGNVAFVRAFWEERDPLPFSAANERLAEQYRRIVEVRKRYLWKKPLLKAKVIGDYIDDLGRPSFDSPMEGRDVDDRGTIYLRHGEPDLRHVDIRGAEYWQYERPGLPEGRLQLHFRLMEGAMGRGRSLARGNDTVYSILPTTEVGLANVRRGHAFEDGVENTQVAVGTDTYPFDYGNRVIPLALAGTTFRNRENPARTDLLLAVGVQLAAIQRLEEGGRTELVQELKLYDHDYREELLLRDTLRLTGGEGDQGALVGAFHITSYPGDRRYALQISSASGALGLARGGWDFPSYAERGLQLSDVLLASRVSAASSDPRAPTREGYAIRPLLNRGFDTTQPLHLYYEIYDLEAEPEGRARYRVEYRVSSEAPVERNLLQSVFGNARSSSEESGVSLAFERENRASPERIGETIALDLSALPPARYRVGVSVRDLTTGREATRIVMLDLKEESR